MPADAPHTRAPHTRSLLSVRDVSLEQVAALLALANELEAEPQAARVQRLAGRIVALLFYESSTRTRTSFELAAKLLGATTTLVSDKSSSIEKGESLHDTGITLRALGAECIILRSNYSGAPELLHAIDRPAGAERGRRHARTSVTGAAGSAHDARSGSRLPEDRARRPRCAASRWSSRATCGTPAWPGPTRCCCPGWARA